MPTVALINELMSNKHGSPKRRDKKRVWKPVASNPLVPRDAQQQELPGLVGVAALGQAWFVKEHLYDILAHGYVAYKLAKEEDVIKASSAICQACLLVLKRQAQTGALGVSGDEMRAIKDNYPTTNTFLSRQPQASIWKAAMQANKDFQEKGYLKIEYIK